MHALFYHIHEKKFQLDVVTWCSCCLQFLFLVHPMCLGSTVLLSWSTCKYTNYDTAYLTENGSGKDWTCHKHKYPRVWFLHYKIIALYPSFWVSVYTVTVTTIHCNVSLDQRSVITHQLVHKEPHLNYNNHATTHRFLPKHSLRLQAGWEEKLCQ